MYKENERIQEEQEPSAIFRRFLQDLVRNSHLGGESIVSHSKNILRIFSKELPEKLYHSKRYSSQSTAGSVSGNYSPSQSATSSQSLNGVWTKSIEGRKEAELEGEENYQGKREDNDNMFQKSFMSRCFSDGLMFAHSSPTQDNSFYSGEILDLELELEVEGQSKTTTNQRETDEWNVKKDFYLYSNSTSASSSSTSSTINSPSPSNTPTSGRPAIYRVMTSTTVAFPSYNEDGMEKLNMALKEDRLRRISTHSNRSWPSNVTTYLKGIDIFLRIPEYVRPMKDGAVLNLSIGSCSHPHPSKVHYGGEDAHFYEENVIGIADGVGEWANFGINPKLFASELISGMREAYLGTKCMQPSSPPNDVAILKKNMVHANAELDMGKSAAMESKEVSEFSGFTQRSKGAKLKFDIGYNKEERGEPQNDLDKDEKEVMLKLGKQFYKDSQTFSYSQFLLMEGYKNTQSFGSSTAFVACFDPKTSKLQISYLGDSGIIILRRTPETFRMGIVYRSPAQQHSFNCPFQLSRLPTHQDFPLLQEKGLTCFINLVKNSEDVPQDLPSHSITKEITLSQSDLIVVATDGLFDNLFDYEICSICSGAISPYEAIRLLKDPKLYSSPHNISKALANAAYIKSLDPKAKTPFNRHCSVSDELWQFSTGGKLDDITVVVAWVVSEKDQIILNSRPDQFKYSKD
ncbi:Ptc7p phosphatase (PP2C family) [Cryptosporidium sp. chipmunk genotype I]|uniref:Ptc7p phosphatase (PP2C family) n=1 Tax=Cryptosporidium sp. chipmunk genotype I TaxID=1280935 RepID=UPI003519E1F2|nr:Ptc7p phosphatase (PP2C family) [Cryptosporidium sp. chipmunk genotype I]